MDDPEGEGVSGPNLTDEMLKTSLGLAALTMQIKPLAESLSENLTMTVVVSSSTSTSILLTEKSLSV